MTLDLDRLSPFAAMESMNMDENVSVPREPIVEKLARAWAAFEKNDPDETLVHPEDSKTGEGVYMWQRYRKEAEDAIRSINRPLVQMILGAMGYNLSPASPPSSVGEEAT